MTARNDRDRNRREAIRRSDSGESLKTLPEYQASLREGELRLSKPIEVAITVPQSNSVPFPNTTETMEEHRRTINFTDANREGRIGFDVEIGNDAPQDRLVSNDDHIAIGQHSLPARRSQQLSIDSYHTVGTIVHPATDEREETSHAHRHDPSTLNQDRAQPLESPCSALPSPQSAMALIPTLPSKIMSSLGRRRPGSSHSGHQRNISAPLSITHLRVEEPASGFSVQQVAFLSSVESLGRYGMALSQADRHNVGNDEQSPPPFETELAQEHGIPLAPLRIAPLLITAERQARSEQVAHESSST